MRIALLTITSLVGCGGHARRIAVGAGEIRTEAQSLIRHGEDAGDPVVVEGATRIDGIASQIGTSVASVSDDVPAWIGAVEWIGIAVVALAVAVILWQTGIGTAIKAAVGWIPRRKVAAAELAADTIDPSRPESERELVAALRAGDPEFDAAYRRAKSRSKTP